MAFEIPKDGFQTLCLSAAASPIYWTPPWVDQMREARQWLEGIRANRDRHLRWEYDPAPAFSA